ncbi:hypothetical protein FRC20_001989 [Serendipita sp. 405]|nr:hypothetical protein FRC15_002034 [Serendipita sp. 397]KAG8786182.1 hypothetical protein FRC16_001791 [Serendipita sp. 398]KAG8831980.1 hypothetical protein FRC18_005671 [Serendipita sp. 400]KAG8850557.1 hypothetical protein FRC20_001989 [Serendipita sp. 405]
MGVDQSKPVTTGDVQLLRVRVGEHDVVTSAPETYEELEASLRNRFFIAEDHRLVISAKLECYGRRLMEIDPNAWFVLKPQLREVWVTARPPPIQKDSNLPKYAESDKLASVPIETRETKPVYLPYFLI